MRQCGTRYVQCKSAGLKRSQQPRLRVLYDCMCVWVFVKAWICTARQGDDRECGRGTATLWTCPSLIRLICHATLTNGAQLTQFRMSTLIDAANKLHDFSLSRFSILFSASGFNWLSLSKVNQRVFFGMYVTRGVCFTLLQGWGFQLV